MGDSSGFSLRQPIFRASDSQTWRGFPSLSPRHSSFPNCNFHFSNSLFSFLFLSVCLKVFRILFTEMVVLEDRGNPRDEEGKIGQIWDGAEAKFSTGRQFVYFRIIA